jgi:hypothetical protein
MSHPLFPRLARWRSLAGPAALTCAASLAATGCTWIRTQRWPEPMARDVTTLPPGEVILHAPGPEEVTIIRHADPVRVRPPGALAGYPLTFYDKTLRRTAGTAVIVSPGGRAEVLWPSGSSIVLSGAGVGWVGSPGRGEPSFDFQEVDRARIQLAAAESVRLMGGAILSGESGPYVLERVRENVLRVINQSKGSVKIAFREEVFELGPSEAVNLPLLSEGGTPIADAASFQRITGPGFNVEVAGAVQPTSTGGAVQVEARGANQVRALGVRVRLGQGERASFSDFSRHEPAADATPPASGAPTPAVGTPKPGSPR